MRFGPMVKRLRLDRHLTQCQLAAKCGLAQPNLAKLERLLSYPTIPTMEKLAKGLGVDIDELFKEPTNPFSHSQMRSICKNLILGRPAPKFVDQALWLDICVSCRSKVHATNPKVRRPKYRLTTNAAHRRMKLRLSREGLNQLVKVFADVAYELFGSGTNEALVF
jgi:transcriptional regulator with XRE-family HTH domain